MSRSRSISMVMLTGVLMTGCGGPSYEDAAQQMAADRDRMSMIAGELSDAVDGLGGSVSFTAEGAMCGGDPAPKAYVKAAAGWSGEEPPAERVNALVAALEGREGWTVLGVDENGGRPLARLERDGLSVSFTESLRRDRRGEVGIGITGPCQPVPSDFLQDLVGGEPRVYDL